MATPITGADATNYTNNVYSGRIGKVTKQIVEGMDTPAKFAVFDKEDIENGEALEITLYEDATGLDYNPAGVNAISDPTSHTLYFNKLDEKTYTAKIDKWDIDKAASSTAYTEKVAGVITETLYGGDNEHVKETMYTNLASLTAGSPNADGSTKLVGVGGVPEITNLATAQAVLTQIKLIAEGMREEPAAFNPYGLKKRPREIVLLLPYETRAKLEVYLFSNAENIDYTRYGVDHVESVPSSKTDGAIYLLDVDYIQNRLRKKVYEERPVFGSGGNVKAALSVSRMFAICPLYCAVKIPQTAVAGAGENALATTLALNTKSVTKNRKAAATKGAQSKVDALMTEAATKTEG